MLSPIEGCKVLKSMECFDMYNDTSIDQLFVDAPVGSLGCYIALQNHL